MTRTAVYRIWCGSDLLYIGASYNPWARYGAHINTKSWAKSATRMDIEWHESREGAFRAERLAITDEQPPCNMLDIARDIAEKANGLAAPLAEWLSKAGLSQAEFAEKTGIHFTAVSRILDNKRKPTKAKAELIERLTDGAVPVEHWGFKPPAYKSPEVAAGIKSLTAGGKTVNEIAAALNLSYATVQKVMNRNGIKPYRKPTEAEEKIRTLSAKGMTTGEAAKLMMVHPSSVSAAAKRYGVTFKDGRRHSRVVAEAKARTAARVERLRNLAQRGYTVTQAANDLGVSQPTVSKLKAQFGIEFPAKRNRSLPQEASQ
mgnify:CR=1 FL=1